MVRQSGWVAGYIAILLFMAAGVFAADGVVEFGDAGLKKAVEKELGKENPSAEDMLKLHQIGENFLWTFQVSVKDLRGLEYATNLRCLYLRSSSIKDFSVLSQLTGLKELYLDNCEISDISPIISAIESHPLIKQISLKGNRITDIQPLLKLKSEKLNWIDLKDNPLNEDAYKSVIPQLQKHIAGIEIFVPFRMVQLMIPGIFFVLFIIAGILVIIRMWKQKEWVFEIISGLLSAGVGFYFGMGAQFLYLSGGELPLFGNGYENPMWVGGIAGGVFGLLAGVWFSQYLRGFLVQRRNEGVVLGKGILGGIGLGILCSIAVHIILMTAYRNTDFTPMLIGIGFGVGAGIVMGFVLWICFVVGHNGLIKGKEKV